MKIHIDRFVSNSDITLDDVIQKFKIGIPHKDCVSVQFKTSDKYVSVELNGSMHTQDYEGQMIVIKPFIYNDKGDLLQDVDYDAFLEHPDFWCARLVIEGTNCHMTATKLALKYEYFITFVADYICLNYYCLSEAELIEYHD